MAPTTIETGRLRLRRPDPADAPTIFQRYASNPEVTRYMSWARHGKLADTEAFLAFSEAEWAAWQVGPYLIESRSDRQLLGSTGLSVQLGNMAITGYILARDAWGRGFATEALACMVELARALGINSLHAACHAGHCASVRVLEKCGFEPDPEGASVGMFPNLNPEPQPALVFIRRLS